MSSKKANAAGRLNDTRADDLSEGSTLLMKHVLEGLRQTKPKASFLAVAQRVLAEERDRLQRERLGSLAGLDTSNLPFPVKGSESGTPAATAGGSVGVSAETLASLPFAPSEPADDEDDAE